MKKFFALALVCALVLALVPSVALAAGVATVNGVEYSDIQEAIKAAAPSGTVELTADVTVDKWIMFAESLSIGSGEIITLVIDGLTINGNGHTLTVKSIESAGNGNRLFYDATRLNINDLTIKCVDAAANQGGIGLKAGVLDNVSFVGGGYGVFPQSGDVTIQDCTFQTNSTAIYFEQERDGLKIDGCTFNQPAGVNAVLLRGDVAFTNNTVNSGRTVNVVSGSPTVTGNDFNDVRLKVYNDATGNIAGNEINNLEFSDPAAPVNSTFRNNGLSQAAQNALNATNTPNLMDPVPAAPADVPETGDHDLPILCAVLALLSLLGMGLVKRVNDRI